MLMFMSWCGCGMWKENSMFLLVVVLVAMLSNLVNCWCKLCCIVFRFMRKMRGLIVLVVCDKF